MNIAQAQLVIEHETLTGYVWFDQPLRPNSIVIRRAESTWELFYTDERATPWPKSIRQYQNESALLDDFIDRLRRKKVDAQIDRELFRNTGL